MEQSNNQANSQKPQQNIYFSYNNLNQQPQQQQQFSFQQMPQQQMPFQSQVPIQQQGFSMQQNIQQPFQLSNNSNVMFDNSNANMNSPFGFQQALSQIRLLSKRDTEKTLAAIIVSFCSGGSYDSLFTTVEQKTMEGTQVLVYACSSNCVNDIYDGMRQKECPQVVKEMLTYIKQVHPDCVVFNWECSGGYSDSSFGEGRDTVMQFLKMILDAGHMAMFSDFSLKALIAQWDSHLLGSNPFVKTGETSGVVSLRFKPAVLKECPSAQLQIIGDMVEGGRCNMHTLGGTIVYSVNQANIDKTAYKLDVLTIKQGGPANGHDLEVDGVKGSAGHVLLTYPKGGYLLTSMGHWVELMKIDTSEKKVFEIAQRQFGKAYAEDMKQKYSSMDATGQQAYIQSQAMNFVQNQAPCSNMNKKSFY